MSGFSETKMSRSVVPDTPVPFATLPPQRGCRAQRHPALVLRALPCEVFFPQVLPDGERHSLLPLEPFVGIAPRTKLAPELVNCGRAKSSM